MGGGGSSTDRPLSETPTWAVAVVCLAFVVISLLLEQGIHHVSKWIKRREKIALYEAFEKLKAELMLLGFISLLLTVGQKPISMICISKILVDTMLPCKKNDTAVERVKVDNGEQHGRKRQWDSMSSEQEVPWRRAVAGAGGDRNHCQSAHGAYPLVSPTGMSQLHIFLFLLAVLHVFFSVSTVALARAKMKRWKAWEQETQTLDYEFSHDPARFKLTHETSFVKRHMSFWTGTPILKWIVCFFRQFCHSVTKTDYLTLRHGFIVAHFAPNSKFNFQKYIKRSLDDDFKSVVGISPPLWAFAIIFLLLNVNGWYTFFWLSFAPLAIVLLVGTKLQVIITEMALEIQDRCSVVKGTPIVRPTNELFWFGRPQLVLFLSISPCSRYQNDLHAKGSLTNCISELFTLNIHGNTNGLMVTYALQNAFQIAYFFWIWYEFGLKSCFHDKFALIISKIIIEVAVQFLCSYITLPLYALVTQMGSHVKKVIFEKEIANALERWQKNATKKVKRHKKSDHSSSGFASRSGLSFRFQSGETHGSSPLHLLHRNKTVGDINTPDISERYYHSDYDASDLEMDATPSYPPQRTESILIRLQDSIPRQMM